MLKVCWDCLRNRDDSDGAYISRVNRDTFNPWPTPQSQSEIMFRLPRALKIEDQIEISGVMKQNPERLLVNLVTGINSPDYQNIACQFEAHFPRENYPEQIILSTVKNGYREDKPVDDYIRPSDLFPDNDFKFIFKVRVNNGFKVDIDVGESNVGSVELKHDLGDITFLTLDQDIMRVEELKFKYV